MKLDEAIVTNFDAAERAALAAGLGVPWDDLPGDTPAARVAALVEALGRAGRAADLPAALALARPAVPWAELPYPTAVLHRLHAALCRRHSLDSLRTLCFRLGVDFDDLPGETKSARARELVLAMDRLGRVGELWGDRSRLDVGERGRKGAGGKGSRGEREKGRRGAGGRWPGASGRLGRRLPSVPHGLARFIRHSSFVTRHSSFVTRHSSFVTRHSYLLLLFLALALLAADGGRGSGQRAMESGQWTVGSGQWAVGRQESPGQSASLLPRPAAPLLPRSFSPVPTAAVSRQPSAGNGATGAATLADAALADGELAADGVPAGGVPAATPAVVLVGERGANLRRGPGPEYPVVATLRAGARLELRAVSPTGEWYQVRLPGRGSPWIDAGYAVIIGGVGGLPVATGAPVTTSGPVATRPPATLPGSRPATAEPTPTRRPAATATPPSIPTPAPTAPPP